MNVALPEPVLEIIKKFQAKNHQIYIVGGAVRDLIMNRQVHDWDFTTNAHPEEILNIFPKKSFYNNKFGTVTVITKDKEKTAFEITTFRKEFNYIDKRHPEKVIWGKTIEKDLSRRDFTINAIAALPKTSKVRSCKLELKIIDPFDGQKDIKEKLIRAVGNPSERFSEDALRMMRAVRIATQLGFLIEDKTFTSIKDNASLIKRIAWERIRDELFRILISPHSAEGVLILYNASLLKHIIPELIKARNVAQARHHTEDVWNHSLKSLQFCPSKDPVVKLATLLHDIGKPATAEGEGEKRTFYNHEVAGARIVTEIGRRLRLSKKQLKKLRCLVRQHQFTVDEKQTDKAIRRFIRRVSKEYLKDMLDLRTGDRLGGGARETSWRLELFKKRLVEVQKQPFSLKDLKVSGNDVMKILKIPPGPKIGKILNALFAEIEEDKDLNNRKHLLSRIPKVAKKL